MSAQPCPQAWPAELDRHGHVVLFHACRYRAGHSVPCRCEHGERDAATVVRAAD